MGGWAVTRILFVCSRNRLRSPTAEQVFSRRPGIEVASAGINPDADEVLTGELVAWAEVIVVMERMHRTKLQRRFRRWLNGQRVVCLDIRDDYAFMDPQLVRLLETRMACYLPASG